MFGLLAEELFGYLPNYEQNDRGDFGLPSGAPQLLSQRVPFRSVGPSGKQGHRPVSKIELKGLSPPPSFLHQTAFGSRCGTRPTSTFFQVAAVRLIADR